MSRDRTFREMWGEPLAATSLLTDWEIKKAIEELGVLISRDVFYDPSSPKYASYEVHASENLGSVDYLEHGELEERHRTNGNNICIPANATVRLFTMEHFDLPPDVFATVIGLGQLYAAGLTVGSTYVDPGTRNRVYLSVSNVTHHDILIPVGAPIGRAQFFVTGVPAQQQKKDPWRADLGYRKGKEVPKAAEEGYVERVRASLQAEVDALKARVEEAGRTAVIGNKAPEGLELLLAKVQQDLHSASARLESASNNLARQRLGLYLLAAIVAGLAVPESWWAALSGEGLPPLAKFLIPAVCGGLALMFVTYLARQAWAVVRRVFERSEGASTPNRPSSS